MPRRDERGRRIVRAHSRRRETDYFDDEDDDDDSFVRSDSAYESDDSFEPRRNSRVRTTRYYRR
jgi:hypothetical protein